MNYKILKGTHVPAYLQLYSQIKDDIINEVYQFNSKLPSKRIVAEELEISTITVEHAYALLCDEGYVEARQRSGYFVRFRGEDGFVSAPKESIRHEISCGGSKTVGVKFPFSVLAKTIRKVTADLGANILNPSPNFGCVEFREAIRKYLGRSRSINTDVEQIIIGSGAEYLYGLLTEVLGKDCLYAIENPSYQKIEQVYLAEGINIEKLKLTSDGIESSALQKTKAKVLHISPYRSFPSGVSASMSKRQEYLSWANTDGRYIIEDDFESEFSVERKVETTVFSLATKDNVIYMNTFSQTISPSLRVAYMVLPKALVPIFEDKVGFYACAVPTIIQYVLTELIESGNFERHINRVRRQKRKLLK